MLYWKTIPNKKPKKFYNFLLYFSWIRSFNFMMVESPSCLTIRTYLKTFLSKIEKAWKLITRQFTIKVKTIVNTSDSWIDLHMVRETIESRFVSLLKKGLFFKLRCQNHGHLDIQSDLKLEIFLDSCSVVSFKGKICFTMTRFNI